VKLPEPPHGVVWLYESDDDIRPRLFRVSGDPEVVYLAVPWPAPIALLFDEPPTADIPRLTYRRREPGVYVREADA